MSKIYILKEEDEIRFTSKIIGAFRKREDAIKRLEEESKVQKYPGEIIGDRWKDSLIIMRYEEDGYEEYGESYVTRTLGVSEVELM